MASALFSCMYLPYRVGRSQISWVSAAGSMGKKSFASTCSEQKTKRWLVLVHTCEVMYWYGGMNNRWEVSLASVEVVWLARLLGGRGYIVWKQDSTDGSSVEVLSLLHWKWPGNEVLTVEFALHVSNLMMALQVESC